MIFDWNFVRVQPLVFTLPVSFFRPFTCYHINKICSGFSASTSLCLQMENSSEPASSITNGLPSLTDVMENLEEFVLRPAPQVTKMRLLTHYIQFLHLQCKKNNNNFETMSHELFNRPVHVGTFIQGFGHSKTTHIDAYAGVHGSVKHVWTGQTTKWKPVKTLGKNLKA